MAPPSTGGFFRRYPVVAAVLVRALILTTSAADAVAPNGARAPSDPEDGQWLRPAKNYASTRFSGLDEIKPDNVKNLRVAWTFSTGIDRGQEAAPIVVGSTMFVVTPYPNIVYALDLANPGTVKWKF